MGMAVPSSTRPSPTRPTLSQAIHARRFGLTDHGQRVPTLLPVTREQMIQGRAEEAAQAVHAGARLSAGANNTKPLPIPPECLPLML